MMWSENNSSENSKMHSRREISKRYYERHRDEVRAQQRSYYRAHAEELKAKARAYYQAHREEILLRRKRKYLAKLRRQAKTKQSSE